MLARQRLLALIGVMALLSGCGWDQRIRVKNRTDEAIVARYDTTDNLLDTGIARELSIPRGSEGELDVQGTFGEAKVRIRFRDAWKTYTAHPDILGIGTIWVREDDFLPAGNG